MGADFGPICGMAHFPQAPKLSTGPKNGPISGFEFWVAGYRHDSASERNSFTAITGCDGGEAESSFWQNDQGSADGNL